MDSKKCFQCKKELLLSEFDIDRRKYQIKADKGRCKVCKECEYMNALRDMSVIRFNFDENKFIITKFETKKEVNNFFNKKMIKGKEINNKIPTIEELREMYVGKLFRYHSKFGGTIENILCEDISICEIIRIENHKRFADEYEVKIISDKRNIYDLKEVEF